MELKANRRKLVMSHEEGTIKRRRDDEMTDVCVEKDVTLKSCASINGQRRLTYKKCHNCIAYKRLSDTIWIHELQ
jgi:hypothetical protein